MASTSQTVTGSDGDDTFVVSADVASINGKGGINTAIFPHPHDWYRTAKTSDGGYDLTEVHATGAKVHLLNIQIARFPGHTYVGLSPNVTVSGTSASDTFIVGSSTTSVTGNGGTDTAVFAKPLASYSVTKTSTEDYDVKDLDTGTSVHLVGIQAMRFANSGTLADAASKSSSSPGAPGAAPRLGSELAKAPALTPARHDGEVVAIRVENNTDQAHTGRIVTFGHAFAEGDIPANSHLIAKTARTQLPIQMDIKATHRDGSVRHAVLSLKAPDLAAHSGAEIMLSTENSANADHPIAAHRIVERGYDTQLILTFRDTTGNHVRTIDAGAELTKALKAGTAQIWTSGPLCTEVRVDTPINDQMHVRFDIRAHMDGTFKTDVQVYNDAAYKPAKTFIYDAEIVDHGRTVFTQSAIAHHQYSNWHKEISSSNAPALHVVQDVGYLVRAGAILPYDTSLGVSTSVLTGDLAKLATSSGPMAAGLVEKSMPNTGGRPDIGPTTKWSANFLASQSEAAKTVMLANADAAGAIPWHLRDTDNQMPTIDRHPRLWLSDRDASADKLTTPYGAAILASGWKPDTAHMPDLSYVPYLFTGSRYYLDQLQAQANYHLLSYDPSYRDGSQGLLYGQIRNMAWTLRDIANAAYVTPDSDKTKSYFINKTNNNIGKLISDYVTNNKMSSAGATKGYVLDSYHPVSMAPWQQDFLALVMVQAERQGFSNARVMAEWQENFISGRFNHAADGYNPLRAPAYWPNFINPDNGKVAATWKELYDINFAGQPAPTEMDGYPESTGGYAAYAKASTAALYSVTHNPDSLEAYARIVQASPKMAANYPKNQTWNITPVLTDGHQLRNSEISVLPANSSVKAQTAHSMLVATSGANALKGGAGIDVLMAGSGNDQLAGESGDDLLFAGTGTTRLDGGSGSNYLKAGSGVDTFVFDPALPAKNIVVGFKGGTDILEIKSSPHGLTAQQLLQGATATTRGDTVLHLSNQHEVVLVGIQPVQVDVHWFHII